MPRSPRHQRCSGTSRRIIKTKVPTGFTAKTYTLAARAGAVAAVAWVLGWDGPLWAENLYDYGEYLSAECTSCHLADNSAGDIPPILGWPEVRFVGALKSFQSGERKHEIMQNVARSLGDDEMAALARFYRLREIEKEEQ